MVMKGSAFAKNNRREIRRTVGRYIAILAIVALGVGFFSGIKVTKTAMIKTGDEYINRTNLFDLRLISTLGLTEADEEFFASVEGVNRAEGSTAADFIAETPDGAEFVLHAISVGEINAPSLVAGKMPEKAGECLLDRQSASESAIGMNIRVSDRNEENTKDLLAYEEYTVVGICDSPLYLNNERGTTTLLDGTVAGFLYIHEAGFDTEVYTEIYIDLDVDGEIFSEEYESGIDGYVEKFEKLLSERADIRYEDIIGEANREIDDAQAEYDDGYAEYLDEIAKLEEEFADAEEELEEAKKLLDDAENTLYVNSSKLDDAQAEYDNGLLLYQSGVEEFNNAKEAALRELEAAQIQITDGKAQTQQGIDAIESSGVPAQYELLVKQISDTEASLALVDPSSTEYAELTAMLQYLTEQKAAIDASGVMVQYEMLLGTAAELDNAQTELDNAKQAAEAAFAVQENELASAKAELDSAHLQITEGRSAVSAGWQQLADGRREYEDGCDELAEAKAEAEKAIAEAEAELEDAGKQIDDAREEIADIPEPDTYVLDRNTNTGYVCFDNDTDIVEGVAKVFPMFFFLVAALVCMTTMTRMVDDQRTQIGTLKALGYSNGKIIWKYVSYSGSAAVIGSIAGFFLGIWIFPTTIWQVYNLLYGFGEIILVTDPVLGIISLTAALVCSAGATYAASRRELNEMPAELMRPRAPVSGKRILLERITFIWKRLTFLHKVTARNIFRYKKRLFMMVLGVGGCTALLITGFGIEDSICNVANDQFGQIMKYDYTISFGESLTKEERMIFLEDTSAELTDCVFITADTVEVDCGDVIKSANIIATDDMQITGLVDLHMGEETVLFPETGTIAVSENIAEAAGLLPGDQVTLRLDDVHTIDVTVSGVFENYVFAYVIMDEATYVNTLGRTPDYSTAYASTDAENLNMGASVLVNEYGVRSVSVNDELRMRVNSMLENMNYIVLLIIICAAALAFIVLFNLSNINLTERQREIATIKVLGFYPRETASYVFRENLVLTAIGAAAGIGLGILLLHYVMSLINIDIVTFDTQIEPVSYIWSVALTFAFTFAVDLMMRRKLNRINMAESLKSVE